MAGLSIKYRWLRDRKTIYTATSPTYTLTERDRGKNISVKIYAQKITYVSPGTAMSASVKVK